MPSLVSRRPKLPIDFKYPKLAITKKRCGPPNTHTHTHPQVSIPNDLQQDEQTQFLKIIGTQIPVTACSACSVQQFVMTFGVICTYQPSSCPPSAHVHECTHTPRRAHMEVPPTHPHPFSVFAKVMLMF